VVYWGGGTPVFENTGTLHKTSSGEMLFSNVQFNNTGILYGVGSIAVQSANLIQSGTINPGIPTGMLTIAGDLPEGTNGIVHIELGGPNVGTDYDDLKVTGVATLRGTLSVDLIGGFTPTPGTTFTVMEFNSRIGSFDSILGLALPNQLFLEPTFTATNLVLTVVDTRTRPVFGQTVRNPDGSPKLSISNVSGQDIILDATPGLEQITWQPVLTNLNSGFIVEYIDSDWRNHPRRFFRVRLAP